VKVAQANVLNSGAFLFPISISFWASKNIVDSLHSRHIKHPLDGYHDQNNLEVDVM
jgi:hypothetical protein